MVKQVLLLARKRAIDKGLDVTVNYARMMEGNIKEKLGERLSQEGQDLSKGKLREEINEQSLVRDIEQRIEQINSNWDNVTNRPGVEWYTGIVTAMKNLHQVNPDKFGAMRDDIFTAIFSSMVAHSADQAQASSVADSFNELLNKISSN